MSGNVESHFVALGRILHRLDVPPETVAFHYVRAALEACNGNISETARRLGMHRRTLQRMLERPEPKPRAST